MKIRLDIRTVNFHLCRLFIVNILSRIYSRILFRSILDFWSIYKIPRTMLSINKLITILCCMFVVIKYACLVDPRDPTHDANDSRINLDFYALSTKQVFSCNSLHFSLESTGLIEPIFKLVSSLFRCL